VSNEVRNVPMVNGRPIMSSPVNVGNRIAAVVAWLIGLATTYLGLAALLLNAPWWLPIAVALVAQGMLTWAERAIWRGRPSLVGALALLLDTLLNAGGVFPYALLLGDTPPVRMFATALGTPAQIGPVGAMIVSLVLGFAIAAAPEEFWARKG
jgi:hypothetical protein